MSYPNPIALAFADNLQLLMQHHDLSQAALARKIGLGQATISKLLNRDSPENMNPRSSTIHTIGEYFGLPGWRMLIPGQTLTDLLTGSTGAPADAPMDAKLMARAIETAMKVFRDERMSPSDEALAAAASFVYARISTGVRVKQAEKAVKDLLAQSAGKNEVLSV